MRAIIAHGTKGSPAGNWFPWLIRELQSNNIEALAPRYPTPAGQSLNSWFRVFDQAAGELKPDDVLVGHSLGAAFSLRLLERGGKALGVFLVAGFARRIGVEEYDVLNSTFVDPSFLWPTIKAAAGTIKVYCGDNDPYVPFEASMQMADALGVKAEIIPGGRHLNEESGWLRFPRILDDLLKLR